MLILPPGHGATVQARPKLARRERRILVLVGVLAAAIVGVTIASIGSSSPRSARGCVYATVPGVIGATVFHECGTGARQLCATLAPGGGLGSYGLAVLSRACRKAGLSVPAALAR